MYSPGKLIALILFCVFMIWIPMGWLLYIAAPLGIICLLAIFVRLGGAAIDAWINRIKEPWTEWDD